MLPHSILSRRTLDFPSKIHWGDYKLFTIRQEQLRTFDEHAECEFHQEMRAHLTSFHPAHAKAAGDNGLERLIASGLERVRSYGYCLRGSLRFFLEQMMLFGHGFDTDPMIPWGGDFRRRGAGDELAWADEIHSQSTLYSETVVGPGGELEQAAIRKFLETPVTTWFAKDLSEAGTCQALSEAYPIKCAVAGTDAVSAITISGRRAAIDAGLPIDSGGFVLSALAVALGHNCATDPQYPWINAQLVDTLKQSGEERVKLLARRAVAFLSTVLTEYERD